MPERHLAGETGRRGHDHPLERDVLDAPRRGAEQERLADPALVDHLLVELTHPRAVGEEHAEQPTVGDGAGVGDGEPLRTGAATDDVGGTVPHDAGSQLGELVGGVPTVEEVEGRGEQVGRELAERRRGPHRSAQLRQRPLVERRHRDDVLGQHVEWVADEAGRLDLAGVHPLHDDGGLDQVGAVLREEPTPTLGAHLMAGATHALQPTGDRAGRLDLDDQVDRAHVDAEFERARGHEAPQATRLEIVLDHEPLFAAERTVVGADEFTSRRWAADVLCAPRGLLVGQLVEPARQTLGQPAGVGEDDGRAVLEDQFEQARMHGGPDAAPHRPGRRGAARQVTTGLVDDLAECPHVVHGNDDLNVEGLADAGVDDRHRPGADHVARARIDHVAAEEVCDLAERPLCGGQPDALG